MISQKANVIESKSLYAEMHARPFPKIQTPAYIGHLLFFSEDSHIHAIGEKIQQLVTEHNITPCVDTGSTFEAKIGDLIIRYGIHNEFETVTIIKSLQINSVHQLEKNNETIFSILKKSGIDINSDNVLVKLLIDVLPMPHNELIAEDINNKYFDTFLQDTWLNASDVMNKRATVLTNFQQDQFGCAKYVVFSKGLSKTSAGRLVTRLIEIEDYRILALLGLNYAKPIAQKMAPIEKRLNEIIEQNSLNIIPAEEKQIQTLSSLLKIAKDVEQMRTETSRRFSATNAYYDIVKYRFAVLKEEKLAGFQGLEIFTERRLAPAIRTCQSADTQLERLSQRIDRVADLLRTEMTLSVQMQNNDLLDAMNRRAETQLKMQHTVESISVVAITYYALGIVSYFLSGIFSAEIKKLILALLVIPTGFFLWKFQRRIIHKIKN